MDRSKYDRDPKFYTTNRDFNPTTSPFVLNYESIVINETTISGSITNTVYNVSLLFQIRFFKLGIFRFTVIEESTSIPRRQIENVLIDKLDEEKADVRISGNLIIAKFGIYTLQMNTNNLHLQLRDEKLRVIAEVNKHRLFNFEHLKPDFEALQKKRNEQNNNIDNNNNESKLIINTSSIPLNLTSNSNSYQTHSVAIDFTFPHSKRVFGLPERSTSLDLPMTRGPYKTAPEAIRLFNLDIFQYDTDSVFPLY
ncbi:MAG: hypothetical protein EZS28_030243, partial [Streblomastix strix]